jgi:hypothetical protein
MEGVDEMRQESAELPRNASAVTLEHADNYFKYCNISLKAEVPDERRAS